MHPRHLSIKNFTYSLPDERIAKYPLPERDLSKLLVYKNGAIAEDVYRKIAQHIPENALLVFNNTKVIHARLLFKNANGATIEIFCLEPAGENTEMASATSQTKSARWNCLIGKASKWKEKKLEYKTDDYTLTAELVERTPDAFVVEFNWQPEHFTFAEILDRTGMMPIPPYLRRASEEIDQSRYQTLYAQYEGSVAAPTAGLHFTENVFENLNAKHVETEYVTLHVGAGTFKPVKAETIGEHLMHAELLDVKIETIKHLLSAVSNNGKAIIAVGTTSLRTIESLYWMGVKANLNPACSIHELEVNQWDPYDIQEPVPAEKALQSLLDWMKKNGLQKMICKTQIMIAPGYRLEIADAIITNFHQPDSTLLLLVAAVVGDKWKEIYDYALSHNFRFLSYGDGSLLWSNPPL